MAEGKDLFETLMLNLVLLKDGSDELWGEEFPIWESETVKRAERTEISLPQSLSELYTLQSRRIELVREQDKVIGYILIGGDFFTKDNAFIEQMTLWRNASKMRKVGCCFSPNVTIHLNKFGVILLQ